MTSISAPTQPTPLAVGQAVIAEQARRDEGSYATTNGREVVAFSDADAYAFEDLLRALATYAGPALAAPLQAAWQGISTALDEARRMVRWQRDHLDRLSRAHDDAAALVARMHEAAVGEVTEPRLGAIEDVQALRDALVHIGALTSRVSEEDYAAVIERVQLTALAGLGLADEGEGEGGDRMTHPDGTARPGVWLKFADRDRRLTSSEVAVAVEQMQQALADTIAAEQREEQQRAEATDAVADALTTEAAQR